jgi:hypothetical protein
VPPAPRRARFGGAAEGGQAVPPAPRRARFGGAAISIGILLLLVIVQALFLLSLRPEADAPQFDIQPPSTVTGIVRIASFQGDIVLRTSLGERPAEVGEAPAEGSEIRVAPEGNCVLAIEKHGEILLGGDATLRFARHPHRADGIDLLLERGAAFVSFTDPAFRDLKDTERVTIHSPHLSCNPLRAAPTEFLLTVE